MTNKYIETTLEDLNIEKYPGLASAIRYIGTGKIRVYESLTLEEDLDLDWSEEEKKDYIAVIVENDLLVKGNISNYGQGGLVLYVLGETHAKNLISTGSLKYFNSLHIDNILLGAYPEGFVKAKNLIAKLLLNDDHTISIEGIKTINYILDRDWTTQEEEKKLAKHFVNNPVLADFINDDDSDGEIFIDFSPMAHPKYFAGKEKEIFTEICSYFIETSTQQVAALENVPRSRSHFLR